MFNLIKNKEGGCYLLLGTVEVDFHFPTTTIHKMAKMSFIPDQDIQRMNRNHYKLLNFTGGRQYDAKKTLSAGT